MNPEQEDLLDRFLTGQIDIEDPELGRAMLQDSGFAREVEAVRSMMGAFKEELGRESLHEDAFPEVSPTEEDIQETQALLEAVHDPSSALSDGKPKRHLSLKLFVPAAAIILAWATIHHFQSGPNTPEEGRYMMGNAGGGHAFPSNGFTALQPPPAFQEKQVEWQITDLEGELLLSHESSNGEPWLLKTEERQKLESYQEVLVNLISASRRADIAQYRWRR